MQLPHHAVLCKGRVKSVPRRVRIGLAPRTPSRDLAICFNAVSLTPGMIAFMVSWRLVFLKILINDRTAARGPAAFIFYFQ